MIEISECPLELIQTRIASISLRTLTNIQIVRHILLAQSRCYGLLQFLISLSCLVFLLCLVDSIDGCFLLNVLLTVLVDILMSILGEILCSLEWTLVKVLLWVECHLHGLVRGEHHGVVVYLGH